MPFKKPHHTSDSDYIKKESEDKFLIQPRGLNIVWGNDSRYWKIPDQGAAELIQVSWLEVSGVVTVPTGKYKVTFDVKVKDDGFGWTGTDVLVMGKDGKTGKYKYKVTRLSPGGETLTIPSPSDPLEIEVKKEKDLLHFGLYEVWSGKWKGGLEIIKAEVSRV